MSEFKDLVGQTLKSVEYNKGMDKIVFITEEGDHYVMMHLQDCCESVSVEDICGDLQDLIGSPILKAEESSNSDNPKYLAEDYPDDSFTWTFYRISTNKGSVVIRWYGTSNGYYSERVDFFKD